MRQEPTDESVINRHMFGQCEYSSSDLDKHVCPGRYQRFYHGKVKQGRKMVDGIVYLDEYNQCTCMCHVPADERPAPKKTRKKTVRKTRRKS